MQTYVVNAFLAAEPAFSKEDVKPGWVALGVVVLLCVAVFFLCRSFIRHAKVAQKPWEGEEADPSIGRTTPHNRG